MRPEIERSLALPAVGLTEKGQFFKEFSLRDGKERAGSCNCPKSVKRVHLNREKSSSVD